jgi:hypothetical protein
VTTDGLREVALVGLHSGGKTTYVVAFFQACVHKTDSVEITNYGVGGREYLNTLAERLSKLQSLERTHQSAPGELRLAVRLEKGGAETELLIPDLAGEHLREGLNLRRLPDVFDELVRVADAALVFVRVDTLEEAQSLVDFNALMAGLKDPDEGEVAPERPEDWEPEFAPTQVRLTDALQELLRLRGNVPLNVGLILSAWDKAGESSPREWALQHLPLLCQFLDNQPGEWEIFGVSAQGGDFRDARDKERLDKLSLSERPYAESDDGNRIGVCEPVKWALSPRP